MLNTNTNANSINRPVCFALVLHNPLTYNIIPFCCFVPMCVCVWINSCYNIFFHFTQNQFCFVTFLTVFLLHEILCFVNRFTSHLHNNSCNFSLIVVGTSLFLCHFHFFLGFVYPLIDLFLYYFTYSPAFHYYLHFSPLFPHTVPLLPFLHCLIPYLLMLPLCYTSFYFSFCYLIFYSYLFHSFSIIFSFPSFPLAFPPSPVSIVCLIYLPLPTRLY